MVTALNLSNCKKGTLQAAVILFACFTVLYMVNPVTLHAQSNDSIKDLFQEAETRFIFNELEVAEELFTRITDDLCSSSDEHLICIESKIYRSIIYRQRRDYDSYSHHLELAGQRAERTVSSDDPVFIKIYSQWAFGYETRDNLEEARYWADRAMEFADEHQPGTEALARAKNISGYIHSAEGNYQEAISLYTESLNLLSELDKDIHIMRLLSQIHTNTGVVYRRLGEPENAVHHYESAREVIIEALGETHFEMALIYNNLGSVYYVLGDRGRAAEYFIRAASILIDNFGENNDRVAMAYNNAGITYLQLGETERGFEYLEKAQEIKLNIHGEDHTETAVGYNNLATYYRMTGQGELAERNYLRSIEIRINIYGEDHPAMIAPLQTLAGLYNEQRKFEEAREQLQRALEIGLERFTYSHPDIVDIYSLIASSYFQEGKLETSLEYYDRTLAYITGGDINQIRTSDDLRSVTYPVKLIENIRGKNRVLKNLYDESGNTDHLHEILQYSSIASQIIDHLQTDFQYEASKLNLLDANYGIYAMALDVLYELHILTGESRWLDDMIFISETSKSRIAMELLQGVEARRFGGVPEEVIARERELNARVTGYFQQLSLEQEKGDETDSRLVRQFRDSLFYAQRELNEFTRSLERDYPSYFALKYDRRIAGRQDIQSLIDSGESLIAYTTGQRYLYAIVVTKNDVHVERVGNHRQTGESVSSLRQYKNSDDSEKFRETAHELYVQLIAPIENHLVGESLIILPDASLHYLPFELLLAAKSDEVGRTDYHRLPFLIKQYEIRYSPSASVMMSRREKQPA
jgi:tetratricopeptide (TPR) repeat protein